jgi:hypothetical protein
MKSSPIPGHWNTVSVTMAKAMMAPSCRPVMVMTGTSVFFSAWPKWTARLDEPARAGELDVVVRSTSSISARTRRMISVSWNRPSVMEGRISALMPLVVRNPVVHQPRRTVSPRPKEGSQPSQTEKVQDQEDPDQEGREGYADQGEGEEEARQPGVAVEARVDAHRHAHQQRQRRGGQRELQRRGRTLGDQVEHRARQPVRTGRTPPALRSRRS